MDRLFPLEEQLLSRSHDTQESLKLLAERYDPPYLSLSGATMTVRKRSLLLAQVKKKKQTGKKESGSFVKKELRKFIVKNQHLQKLYKRDKKVDVLKKMVKYDDYLKMNELWIGYIQDLLMIDNGDCKTSLKIVLQKLSSAEFVGCHVNVLNSHNKDIVGKNGIIVVDTMKYFLIIEDVNGGQLKMVMKEGSVFNFIIPLVSVDEMRKESSDLENVLEFSIIGSRVCYRSDDRATRKFKAKASDDLDVLLKRS